MTVTTDVNDLVINKMTKAQYEALENPSETELYLIVDDKYSYDDLENKPTIGNATVTIQKNSATIDSFNVNTTTDKSINISVPTTVAELSDANNYAQTNSLADVATSGDYDDLENKPTIGDAIITIQKNGTAVDTFTTNATIDKSINIIVPTTVAELSDANNYAQTNSLADVATSGDYDDLIDKPTIGNATITIQKNSTTVDSFSANATTDKSINIIVPTRVSDLSDASSYYTSAQVDSAIGTAISSVYRYKGSVATYSQLPSTSLTAGDVYNVEDTGANYGWTGTDWDKLSDDLTNYVTLSGTQTLTNKTISLSDNTVTGLANVATSGSYNDLSNTPTIGNATITIQKNGTNIDTFTTNATSNKSINISVPTTVAELSDSSNYALYSSLSTVAATGSYNDLLNKPTIGNATITIQKNGTAVDTFTTNATTNKSINIAVPTKVTDLSDASNYALDANVVHKTGNETIAGTKTFSSTINGTALNAQWADLAENYKSDSNYREGTLIEFGGEKEITIAKSKVNGVISSQPAILMNREQRGVPVALAGRVPVRIKGKVSKFDKICLSETEGVGRKKKWYEVSKRTIGIALESKDVDDIKLVLCVTKFNLD